MAERRVPGLGSPKPGRVYRYRESTVDYADGDSVRVSSFEPVDIDAIVSERCRPLLEALEWIAANTAERHAQGIADDALAEFRAQSEAT